MKPQGLLGSILIAIAIVVFFALVMPKYDEIRATQQAIDERQVLLDDLNEALSRVNSLKAEISASSSDVEKVGGVITGPKNTDEILVALEVMAEESGVQISNISIAEGKTDGTFETLVMKLDGSGVYSSLKLLLERLEKNTRLFDVKKITLNDAGIFLNFSMEINVYYLD
jgi:hypothetical protein